MRQVPWSSTGFLLAGLLNVPLQAQPVEAAADDPADLISRIEAPREAGASDDAGKSLAELMEAHGIAALSVAVVEDYRLHWARAWGVADEASGTLADTETLFQAASISKPVSAMAVLRAVQDGLFDLDANINSILRSWKLRDEAELLAETPVTPRMLLSMTAGTTFRDSPATSPTSNCRQFPRSSAARVKRRPPTPSRSSSAGSPAPVTSTREAARPSCSSP